MPRTIDSYKGSEFIFAVRYISEYILNRNVFVIVTKVQNIQEIFAQVRSAL